jgi:hypothetical protein
MRTTACLWLRTLTGLEIAVEDAVLVQRAHARQHARAVEARVVHGDVAQLGVGEEGEELAALRGESQTRGVKAAKVSEGRLCDEDRRSKPAPARLGVTNP